MTTAPPSPDLILSLLPDQTERNRYRNVHQTLSEWAYLFSGRTVLDFGASWGTSMVALHRLGAGKVIGVEVDTERVHAGREILARVIGPVGWQLHHVADTRHLPFPPGEFEVVLANAVFEHIPQPREAWIREVWRVLSPGGYLVVPETPNKYFPHERHTTGLWFNHWLPRDRARHRAIQRGRFNPERSDWDSSGWRGLGYYEMVSPLTGFTLVPEGTRLRHRVLATLGLPASLIDPYPTWVLRKQGHHA